MSDYNLRCKMWCLSIQFFCFNKLNTIGCNAGSVFSGNTETLGPSVLPVLRLLMFGAYFDTRLHSRYRISVELPDGHSQLSVNLFSSRLWAVLPSTAECVRRVFPAPCFSTPNTHLKYWLISLPFRGYNLNKRHRNNVTDIYILRPLPWDCE